jgi:tetratricopeptide (TPR) repeat protein
MTRDPRCARLLALAAAASLLPACGGHGAYTREGVSLAKQRLDGIKAATEYDMARQAFMAGDLDKAMKKTTSALALTDENAALHVLRGRIHLERGSIGEALLSLRRALEIDPESVDGHAYLGVVHERLGEPEQALAAFNAAAALDPYNAQHTIAAGEMLIDLGRVGEARSLLSSSVAAEHAAGVQQLLGHVALIESDAAGACLFFNKARLLAPDDGAILEDLAAAQIAAGRYAEADSNLIHLLRDPQNAGRRDLLHMRAECLMALDRPVDAREIYRGLILGEGASDAAAWVGLGRAAFTLRDENEQRRAASRVVSIAPDDPNGYVLWAMCHLAAGEPGAALEKLDAGLMRARRSADLLGARAMVLMELGRAPEALASAQAALEIDPANRACLAIADALGEFAVAPTN